MSVVVVMFYYCINVFLVFVNIFSDVFVLLQPGLAAQMLSAAEERPWLWVVYVLTVALPLVLIVVFCCTGKVKNTHTHQVEGY